MTSVFKVYHKFADKKLIMNDSKMEFVSFSDSIFYQFGMNKLSFQQVSWKKPVKTIVCFYYSL